MICPVVKPVSSFPGTCTMMVPAACMRNPFSVTVTPLVSGKASRASQVKTSPTSY